MKSPEVLSVSYDSVEMVVEIDSKSEDLASDTFSAAKGHSNFRSPLLLDNGMYYFEFLILNPRMSIIEFLNTFTKKKKIEDYRQSHYDYILKDNKLNPLYKSTVRVGIVSVKESFDASLGCSNTSYAYRSTDGALINDTEKKLTGVSAEIGDVIGILAFVRPPIPDFLKDKIDPANKQFLKFYVNGKEVKEQFIGLNDNFFNPALTLYNFARVKSVKEKEQKYFVNVKKDYPNCLQKCFSV